MNNEEFLENIELTSAEKIQMFESGDYVGFSMTKDYSNLKVIRNDNQNDLYCLLKIAYKIKDIAKKKKLLIDCSIQSRFRDKYHGIAYNSESSPDYLKEESLRIFKNGWIPFNITVSKKNNYYYSLEENKFYKGDKVTNLRKIVDDVFSIHEKSTKWYIQYTYKYSSFIISYIFEIIAYHFLYKFLHRLVIGGNKIKDEEYFHFFMHLGNKMVVEDEKLMIESKRNLEVSLPLFGGKLNMNKNGIFWGIFVIGLISVLDYTCDYKNPTISLFKYYEDNEIILGVLFIIWIYIFSFTFSYIFPNITIFLINGVVKLRKGIVDSFYYHDFDYNTGNSPYK